MKTGLTVVLAIAAFPAIFANAQMAAPRAAAAAQSASTPTHTKPALPALAANYGKLPLSFEANQGQTDPQVKFLSRGNGYSLFLTDSAAVLALTKGDPAEVKPGRLPGLGRLGVAGKNAATQPKAAKTDVVGMELAGARRDLKVAGADQLPGTANYFIGNDPKKWHSSVPTYAKVKYAGVYPGIDLVYYGNQRQLEYDFVVAPGASPKPIRLHFAGAARLGLDGDGNLQVVASNGSVAFHKPVVYQDMNGQREPVEGQFKLLADNSVGFKLGRYDKKRALVIDPTLAYSTYLGGSIDDVGIGIAVDAAGFAYVTGSAVSADFPTTAGAFETNFPDGGLAYQTAFITKLSSGGNGLVYSTYLGGTGDGYGDAIAVDSAGSAYVCGLASSTDFPITAGAFQTTNYSAMSGKSTPFIAKLSGDGTKLIYSTFLGGKGGPAGGDNPYGIKVDGSGSAYVAGFASSSDFPIKNAYQSSNKAAATQGSNGFVT